MTADVAATAPAPTLRKSRRVVFISTPPETCLTDMGFLRSTRDVRECHAAAAPARILFTILTSGSLTSSPPVFTILSAERMGTVMSEPPWNKNWAVHTAGIHQRPWLERRARGL